MAKPPKVADLGAARSSKQKLRDELHAAQQRCLDQEATIDVMRKLFVALIVKHGTAGTLIVDKKDMDAIGSTGELKVQEMPHGIVLAARIGGLMPQHRRPVLIRK